MKTLQKTGLIILGALPLMIRAEVKEIPFTLDAGTELSEQNNK
jgi:hypothetical protein